MNCRPAAPAREAPCWRRGLAKKLVPVWDCCPLTPTPLPEYRGEGLTGQTLSVAAANGTNARGNTSIEADNAVYVGDLEKCAPTRPQL